jgi:hypothetical protein
MLFDLRSRRRRTAVRVIYSFLALIMAGGLILVGVGTGNGSGGLLNGLANSNSGSGGSNSNALAVKQAQTALKQTQQNPDSASAWTNLMQAKLTEARGELTSAGAFNTAGKAALAEGLVAWNHYLTLSNKKPSITSALLAKELYAGTGSYAGMATAYQYLVAAEPSADAAGAYKCLAYTAYAAKRTPLGDLAAAKAVSLAPTKLQKGTLSTSFKSARSTQTTAEQAVVTNSC